MRLTHWARPRLDPDEEQDMKYKTKEAAGLDKAVSELASDKQGVETELGDKATLEMSERTKMATPPYPFLGPRTRSRRPTNGRAVQAAGGVHVVACGGVSRRCGGEEDRCWHPVSGEIDWLGKELREQAKGARSRRLSEAQEEPQEP